MIEGNPGVTTPPIVLLTSTSRRHAYVATRLAAEFDLVLVVREEKGLDTTNEGHPDKDIIEDHFHRLAAAETAFFTGFDWSGVTALTIIVERGRLNTDYPWPPAACRVCVRSAAAVSWRERAGRGSLPHQHRHRLRLQTADPRTVAGNCSSSSSPNARLVGSRRCDNPGRRNVNGCILNRIERTGLHRHLLYDHGYGEKTGRAGHGWLPCHESPAAGRRYP